MSDQRPPGGRTEAAPAPDGRIRLISPDGVVVYIPLRMAIDVLSNEMTRCDLRRAIWNKSRLWAVIEDNGETA